MYAIPRAEAIASGIEGLGRFHRPQRGMGPVEVFLAALGEQAQHAPAIREQDNFRAVGLRDDLGRLARRRQDLQQDAP